MYHCERSWFRKISVNWDHHPSFENKQIVETTKMDSLLMEHPMKMDDLGVPPFQETSILVGVYFSDLPE
jgi:hypothetical protein